MRASSLHKMPTVLSVICIPTLKRQMDLSVTSSQESGIAT